MGTRRRVNLYIDGDTFEGMKELVTEKHGISLSQFTEFTYKLMLSLEKEGGPEEFKKRAATMLSRHGVENPGEEERFAAILQVMSGFMRVWLEAYSQGANLKRSGVGGGPKPKNADQDEAEPETSKTG